MWLFDFMNDDYFFNRPVKDMTPYKVIKKDGKTIVVLNTLGISPDDIKVQVEAGELSTQILHVSGKTRNDLCGKDYDINMKLAIRKPIKKIEWESKDGLTYLTLIFTEPEKPSVSIVRK